MSKSIVNPLDRVFAALADPTRRDMVLRLLREGDLGVSKLAAAYDITLPSISYHLQALEQAGLIERSRDGRQRRVSLRVDSLTELKEWVATVDVSATSAAAPVANTLLVPSEREESVALAASLGASLAPGIAVIELAFALASGTVTASADFSPTVHLARRVAGAVQRSPALAAELSQGAALYRSLRQALDAPAQDVSAPAILAAALPLGRTLFKWGHDPLLEEVFGSALVVDQREAMGFARQEGSGSGGDSRQQSQAAGAA